MYRKKNKIRRVFIICGAFLCLILSSVVINRRFNLPNFFIKDGILFIDKALTGNFKSCGDDEYNKLMVENENLRKELDSVKSYQSENEELVNEISKLKELTKINKSLGDKEYINSSVLSRGLDYWNESLMIDKGSNDGINNNMAVISGGSLIGITSNVSNFNSNVSLLTNYKFPINISVKIKVNDSYVYGILNNYSNGLFEVMGIVDNISIPDGSKVVTTGLGNIFPSGLLVGYVTDVSTDNFDLSKIVNVKSNINFDDISYVTVVKKGEK